MRGPDCICGPVADGDPIRRLHRCPTHGEVEISWVPVKGTRCSCPNGPLLIRVGDCPVHGVEAMPEEWTSPSGPAYTPDQLGPALARALFETDEEASAIAERVSDGGKSMPLAAALERAWQLGDPVVVHFDAAAGGAQPRRSQVRCDNAKRLRRRANKRALAITAALKRGGTT